MTEKETILKMANISKSFAAVKALDGVDFELYNNEILALLGDNGAGKSTLIKIISGTYGADSGNMWVYGQKVEFKNPHEAQDMGIETIYQDLALFDNLDVMANIYAGREATRKGLRGLLGFVDKKSMFSESTKVVSQLGVNIADYRDTVLNFSGGQRQSVAIAKAVTWGHQIIIMDEPTAALGVRETANVMELIRTLKKNNVSVILIMHNIDQVVEIAERAIVLRRGKRVGEVDIVAEGPACHEKIVKMLL